MIKNQAQLHPRKMSIVISKQLSEFAFDTIDTRSEYYALPTQERNLHLFSFFIFQNAREHSKLLFRLSQRFQ